LVTPLQDMRVLITGGGRGIGFEIAKDLAASGTRIWLGGRSESVCAARNNLGSSGIEASTHDVGDTHSVAALFQRIRATWGGLDAVIHSAAILGEAGRFWEISTESAWQVLRVNTLGTYLVCREFVNLWLERRGSGRRGKLILFAGGGAAYGYPKFLPYGCSKAADVRMCETMSIELAEAGIDIDVNIVAPGANDTDMLRQVRQAGAEVRTVVPFSKPIALCRWLLSPASDGITGLFLHVNDAYQQLAQRKLREGAFQLRRVEP